MNVLEQLITYTTIDKKELALRLGVTVHKISKFASGKATPNPLEKQKIEDIYGISLNAKHFDIYKYKHALINSSFSGDKLRFYRLKAGLSRAEIAEMLGIKTITYSKLENNGRDINKYLVSLHKILDLDLTRFTDDSVEILLLKEKWEEITDGAGLFYRYFRRSQNMTAEKFINLLGISKEDLLLYESSTDPNLEYERMLSICFGINFNKTGVRGFKDIKGSFLTESPNPYVFSYYVMQYIEKYRVEHNLAIREFTDKLITTPLVYMQCLQGSRFLNMFILKQFNKNINYEGSSNTVLDLFVEAKAKNKSMKELLGTDIF